MSVHADQSLCQGTGSCVMAAPDVFDQDEDGLVIVVDGADPDAAPDAVREAVSQCPTAAIRLSGPAAG
ncbi:ferredoxin [Streptomyces odontomachi]|uniref:ferredoxin n=1 Tax=Streptomyces odontomachi TaxID=2944940 RepID=UPI00210CFCC4|nr:ferredoxin [Streptomyces sp. ODS25]